MVSAPPRDAPSAAGSPLLSPEAIMSCANRVPAPQVNPLQADSKRRIGPDPQRACGPRMSLAQRLIRSALVALASLGLVDCETHRTLTTTEPVAPATDTEAALSVTELGATSLTSTVQGSTLGGPLAGLDAALLARFNAGREEFMDVDDVDEGLG